MIEQNDPLLLNYGCLNNDLLLLDYGFVIHSNPYDSIELRYDGALLDAASMAAGVSSPSFLAPAPWQEDILSQLNFYGETPLLKVCALLTCHWSSFGLILSQRTLSLLSTICCLRNVHLETLKH